MRSRQHHFIDHALRCRHHHNQFATRRRRPPEWRSSAPKKGRRPCHRARITRPDRAQLICCPSRCHPPRCIPRIRVSDARHRPGSAPPPASAPHALTGDRFEGLLQPLRRHLQLAHCSDFQLIETLTVIEQGLVTIVPDRGQDFLDGCKNLVVRAPNPRRATAATRAGNLASLLSSRLIFIITPRPFRCARPVPGPPCFSFLARPD